MVTLKHILTFFIYIVMALFPMLSHALYSVEVGDDAIEVSNGGSAKILVRDCNLYVQSSEDSSEKRYCADSTKIWSEVIQGLDGYELEAFIETLKSISDEKAYAILGWFYAQRSEGSTEMNPNLEEALKYWQQYHDGGGRDVSIIAELEHIYRLKKFYVAKHLLKSSILQVKQSKCLYNHEYIYLLYDLYESPEKKQPLSRSFNTRNAFILYNFTIKYLREIRKMPFGKIKRHQNKMQRFAWGQSVSNMKFDEIDVILCWQEKTKYPDPAFNFHWPPQLKNWVKNWQQEIEKEIREKSMSAHPFLENEKGESSKKVHFEVII